MHQIRYTQTDPQTDRQTDWPGKPWRFTLHRSVNLENELFTLQLTNIFRGSIKIILRNAQVIYPLQNFTSFLVDPFVFAVVDCRQNINNIFKVHTPMECEPSGFTWSVCLSVCLRVSDLMQVINLNRSSTVKMLSLLQLSQLI